jgi:CheY-like chemotaxis protein
MGSDKVMAQASSASLHIDRKPLLLEGPEGRRPRLLLAEDSDPVRVVTAAMLKGMGCDVEAVIHGEQAVRCASENQFDVIVLDIEMPVMDGITAARSIRRMGGVAGGTPLMALSAFLADSGRTGTWRDTFDIALPKPANKNELHDAVKTALSFQHQDEEEDLSQDLPPVIDQQQCEALRSGITGGIWEELARVACRDIEICVNQLEHIAHGRQDGAILTYTSKLGALGQAFAAPRLALLARIVQMAPSESIRTQAVAALLMAARDTAAMLRS